MIEVCAGSVSGTVVYACVNRWPLAASALKAGVVTPRASGPIASARVVSSVTSRIDGRTAAGGVGAGPPPHAEISAAAAAIEMAPRIRTRISARVRPRV
jgi:hypothetical protein